MKTSEQRRNDIRDEMLIDMARGIQAILQMKVGMGTAGQALTISGRLESHINFLQEAKEE